MTQHYSRRRRLDERINSGGDLRSRLGARRGSGGRRRGSGGDDSLEREHLDADLRAELNSKKRGMQIEVRGDGKRRGKVITYLLFCFDQGVRSVFHSICSSTWVGLGLG